MAAIMGVAEAIIESRKRKTKDGRVTVEYDAMHAAAIARGMAFIKPIQAMRAVRELGGERISNGHNGARYAFDQTTLERVSDRAQRERFLNRIEGVEHPVTLIASITFPRGIDLLPQDFANGLLLPSAADLKTTCVLNFASLQGEAADSEGAWIALCVRKDGTADAALSLLTRGEHVPGEGGERAQTVIGPNADKVSIAVTFADGSCADFTTGVLLHVVEWSECREYLFHFSETNRDY